MREIEAVVVALELMMRAGLSDYGRLSTPAKLADAAEAYVAIMMDMGADFAYVAMAAKDCARRMDEVPSAKALAEACHRAKANATTTVGIDVGGKIALITVPKTGDDMADAEAIALECERRGLPVPSKALPGPVTPEVVQRFEAALAKLESKPMPGADE